MSEWIDWDKMMAMIKEMNLDEVQKLRDILEVDMLRKQFNQMLVEE